MSQELRMKIFHYCCISHTCHWCRWGHWWHIHDELGGEGKIWEIWGALYLWMILWRPHGLKLRWPPREPLTREIPEARQEKPQSTVRNLRLLRGRGDGVGSGKVSVNTLEDAGGITGCIQTMGNSKLENNWK